MPKDYASSDGASNEDSEDPLPNFNERASSKPETRTSVKNSLNHRVSKDYASSDDASRNETSSDETSNVDSEDPVPAIELNEGL